MNYCLDTTFLIDLQKERRRGAGPASQFLDQNAGAAFFVPVVAWGEFIEGRTEDNAPMIADIRGTLELLPVTEIVAERYGRIVRKLRSAGNLIGALDLWIAATALAAEMILVTRNKRDFGKVDGLGLSDY